jgi:uncharacterized membrane protein YhaH (DUF805 family)
MTPTHCISCGSEVPDHAKFCQACGSVVNRPASGEDQPPEPFEAEPSVEQPPEPAPAEAPVPETGNEADVAGPITASVTPLRLILVALVVIAAVVMWRVTDGDQRDYLYDSPFVPTTFLIVIGWLLLPGLKWYRKAVWDNCLRSLVSKAKHDKRASREEYGMYALWNLFMPVAFGVLASYGNELLGVSLFTVYCFFQIIPSMNVTCRRLHDLGFNSWWLLILGIPAVNVVSLLILFFDKGDPLENRYGPPPER